MKYTLLSVTLLLGFILWVIPPPSGIDENTWHLFAIFTATIFGIITKPLPMGSIALAGLAATLLTKTLTFDEAFKGFSNEVVWLIVFAFFVARGLIKTGLGNRISYLFMMLLGRKTLGLGYGIVATDLILAPAIPSSTARTGGVLFPILESLALSFDSKPNHPSSNRMGSYLTQVAMQSTCITSAMFLTSMAANPLIAEIAATYQLKITWTSWAIAAIVPGLISIGILPLAIFWLYPPEIKESPYATKFAKSKLKEMGPISKEEWIMIVTFIFLIALWIFGPILQIKATVTALTGLVLLLITGVLSWNDIKKEEGAWETLIWFAILLMLASELNHRGFMDWVSERIVFGIQDMPWFWGFNLLAIIYFYSHYLFASNLAHVGAMYATFLVVSISMGTPASLAALVLGFFSSLFGGLTQYSCGPAAMLFAAGYVPIGTWWKIGALISMINVFIWIFFGGIWWKILGYW